jgi:polyhydroxybutyrate depolymerase
MIKRILFAMGMAFAAQTLAGGEVLARDLQSNVQIGGFQRSYTVYIPDRLQLPRSPFPAVVVLHGGLGNGSVIRRQMRMDPIAEREGFVVVYPDGLGRAWNDGREDRIRQRGAYGRADDAAFLRTVVDTLVRDGIAQRSKVFLTGVSNGGMMSLRMACEAADYFAGIVPIVASMPADIASSCAPSRPLPILLINATSDPLVPWSGGGVGFRGGRGQVISTEDTIAFWLRVNGCSSSPAELSRTSGAPAKVTEAKMKLYKNCNSGAPVALIRIEGGGHRIPGREERSHPVIDWFLGPQNHDFETAEEAWRFFADVASR